MEPASVVVGILALALGAVGATVTERRLEAARHGRWIPLLLAPFGALVGGGAALIRGWDLAIAMLVGSGVVPLVAVVGRAWEVRRRRRRS
ncbi:MAG: hypothetical protein WD152_05970 [Nitriliruptoraceae bacterium]